MLPYLCVFGLLDGCVFGKLHQLLGMLGGVTLGHAEDGADLEILIAKGILSMMVLFSAASMLPM
jgi:hypothetical protein